MVGVSISIALTCAFLGVLWVLWLQAQPPTSTALPEEDIAPPGAPTPIPRGTMRLDQYVQQGIDDMEAWVREQARRPDAGP
ncbi:MAG: hypothetical protein ACRDYU_01640 [Actinomycetes bacterium]